MALLSKKLEKWRHAVLEPYVHGDVLDLGCGNAVVLDAFGDSINYYCGVEGSPSYIENIHRRHPNACIYKRNLDKEPLELGKEFDVVLMIALIEHIWNQRFLFEQVISCLKPGGKIVITTPTPFGNDIIHRLGAKVGLFAQAAVDDHIVIYNKMRFLNLSNEFGLKILKYKKFQFFSNQLVVMEKCPSK